MILRTGFVGTVTLVLRLAACGSDGDPKAHTSVEAAASTDSGMSGGKTLVLDRADRGRSGWPQRTLAATWAGALGSAASRQGHVQRRDVTNAGRLSPELRPLPFGDHLDGAVDDLDGRLFVDGVGRDADFGGPPLCVSQGVRGESVQVREDREVDDS